MTRVLAIDTAGPVLGLALVHNGELHSASDNSGPLQHVEQIVPRIDATLSYAGWDLRSVDAVAISAGPGSFTGLRVGMAAAKAVALAQGIPVVSIDTLRALAATEYHLRGTRGSSPTPAVIVPVLDARKNRFYAAAFQNTNRLEPLAERGDLTYDQVCGMIQTVLPSPDSRWCTPGTVSHHFETEPGFIAAEVCGGSAAPGTALLGYQHVLLGNSDDSYQGPFYLRSGDIGGRSSIPRFSADQDTN